MLKLAAILVSFLSIVALLQQGAVAGGTFESTLEQKEQPFHFATGQFQDGPNPEGERAPPYCLEQMCPEGVARDQNCTPFVFWTALLTLVCR